MKHEVTGPCSGMQPVAFVFDGVFTYTQHGRNSFHCLLSEEVLHKIAKNSLLIAENLLLEKYLLSAVR